MKDWTLNVESIHLDLYGFYLVILHLGIWWALIKYILTFNYERDPKIFSFLIER